MIRTMLAAAAAFSLLVGTAVGAAPCRDPKTHKFIKCPPPAANGDATKHDSQDDHRDNTTTMLP